MRVLAEFVMQGRWRAVGAVVGLGGLGVVFPPIAVLSSAVVGLVGLRLGMGQAVFVAGVGSVLLGALVMLLMGASPVVGMLAGLVQWLPVVAMAEILRRTISWRSTLSMAAGATGTLVVIVHLLVPNLTEAWIGLGQEMLQPFITDEQVSSDDLIMGLSRVAPFMTGLLAGLFLLSMILSLIIARYWQALLYNPGAFGTEFRALDLGRHLAMATVFLAAAGYLLQISLGLELAFLLLVLFFLQGLAVMHGLTHAQQMSQFWLVGLYVMLVLIPHMFLFLAALGIVDTLARFRERFNPPPPPNRESE